MSLKFRFCWLRTQGLICSSHLHEIFGNFGERNKKPRFWVPNGYGWVESTQVLGGNEPSAIAAAVADLWAYSKFFPPFFQPGTSCIWLTSGGCETWFDA